MALGGWLLVLITAPADEAERLAERLVEERLAACVNVLGEADSIYWWKGRVEKARERILVVKTRAQLFDKLVERVKQLHSYTVPEIIALPIIMGSRGYLEWLAEETRGEEG